MSFRSQLALLLGEGSGQHSMVGAPDRIARIPERGRVLQGHSPRDLTSSQKPRLQSSAAPIAPSPQSLITKGLQCLAVAVFCLWPSSQAIMKAPWAQSFNVLFNCYIQLNCSSVWYVVSKSYKTVFFQILTETAPFPQGFLAFPPVCHFLAFPQSVSLLFYTVLCINVFFPLHNSPGACIDLF